MVSISNVDIENFFENQDEDIKRNFMGVYSSNSITKFINYSKIMKGKDSVYLFVIFNTDGSNKPGTHWWSFLNIEPQSEHFLFDSEGFQGFKYFIADNDYPTINKLLYNLNKFNKKDNKIDLVSLKFSSKIYHKLTETARNFFQLSAEFTKVNNLTNEMTIIMMDNEVQELYSDICSNFQLYFYKNLMDPVKKSKIIPDEKLTKKTLEVLLNKIFITNEKENKCKVAEFSKHEFNK